MTDPIRRTPAGSPGPDPEAGLQAVRSPRSMRRLAMMTSFALASLLGISAPLADGDEGEARELFKSGVTLLNKGSFVDALDRFERAYQLWRNPKILLNIATTLRELGRLTEAASAYESYLQDPEADNTRIADVRKALAEIDAKIAAVTVDVKTEGASVSVDGREVERKPASAGGTWFARVMPGDHVVTISKDGFHTHTEKLTAEAGEKLTLRVMLEPIERDTPPAPQPVSTAPTPAPAEPESLSHDSQASVFARGDIDGKFRGAVAVVGVGYGLGDVLELQAAALVGRDKGFEVGASLYLSTGVLKPVVYVGSPTFFADGASPGLHAAIGLQVDPSRHLGLFAQVGGAAFLNAPETRESAAFVPSLGAQGRF